VNPFGPRLARAFAAAMLALCAARDTSHAQAPRVTSPPPATATPAESDASPCPASAGSKPSPSRMPLAIATMALALFLKETVKDFYSAEAQPFPPLAAATNVSIFGVPVAVQSLIVVGLAVAAVVALQFFLNRTRTGRQMQATAQNPNVARILGIPVERMILIAFLINAALAALASALVTPIYLAKFSNGEYLGMAAFIAAIVGGFNQVRGAIVGGLLLGVADNFAAAYLSAQYRAAIPLVLLIAVILFRPQGLLGRAEERTV